MTRPVVALDAITDHGASLRLPGGGPRSRWSPRRLAPSAWWWTGATLVLGLACTLLLLAVMRGGVDLGTGAVALTGALIVALLVFSWTWGTVAEHWRQRVGDDVHVHTVGVPVTLSVGPVPGDGEAIAAVTVAGRPVGTLRERAGQRTLVGDGRVHTLERASVSEPGTDRRHRTLTVRDAAGRALAAATRFRSPAGTVSDWRVRAGGVDLWLRVRRDHEPRRRTLLDDRGRAWRTRPRRAVAENEVVGATTELPAELGPIVAAGVAWLLTRIERDGAARPTVGRGDAVDDPWTWTDSCSDTAGGGGGGGGGGGDSWW